MTIERQNSPVDARNTLPFDVGTLVRGVRGRWPILLAIVLVASVIGVAAAMSLGVRTYEAETVLLYQPGIGCPSTICTVTPPSLSSIADLVKVQPLLAGVRKKLGWAATLQELGASVTVVAKKSSDLLILRARSDNPDNARALCVAVRDAFLAEQAGRLRSDKARELQQRADSIRLERVTIETQLAGLSERTTAFRSQASTERKQLGLDDPDRARIQRQIFLENITEDQRRRVASIELAQAEIEYRRAQQLAEKGLIGAAELDKAKTAYERAKAGVLDSPQAQEWKAERQRLEAQAASGGYGLTPAEQLLLLALNRSLELELLRVAAVEKERAMQSDIRKVAATNDVLGTPETGFTVISQPERQPRPVASTRRLLAIAVAALIILAGFGAVVGREMLDRTIRSSADAALHLGISPMATIPAVQHDVGVEPQKTYRFLATRLKRMIQSNGWRRVLVASVVSGEGRSTLCAALANNLIAIGERVCVESVHTEEPPGQPNAPAPSPHRDSPTLPCEVTIIDGPAILACPDVDLLPASVDCALVVVKAGSTQRELVGRAVSRLREAGIPILGLVLNASPRSFLRARDVAEGGL